MNPSPADFSQILELQQFRRLYEEQEEKVKVRIGEKEEEISHLQREMQGRDEQIRQQQARMRQMTEDHEKMRGEYNRLRQEAEEKIKKLMERNKELNQQLLGKR